MPQGSTLGPLLFLLYINDLNRAFSKCVVHHFADYTNLIFASKKKETIETVMNHELTILVEWLKANKLSLNGSKTELIIFHSQYKRIPNISIKINSFKLVIKSYVNYLGILIDEVLSWNKQYETLLSKLSRVTGVLSKLRHFAPNNVLKSVYYGLFYSHVLLWLFSLAI